MNVEHIIVVGGEATGLDEIHVKGVNGYHTLCGVCDDGQPQVTDKPVNCRMCLKAWRYVKRLSLGNKGASDE